MNRRKTERPKLRVHKHTLRTLSSNEAAKVHGGKRSPPGPGNPCPHSPYDSRYCLNIEEP